MLRQQCYHQIHERAKRLLNHRWQVQRHIPAAHNTRRVHVEVADSPFSTLLLELVGLRVAYATEVRGVDVQQRRPVPQRLPNKREM